MNILFLGSFIPDEYAENFGELSAAGNQFQYNLYNALSKNYEMHALCYLPIHLGKISEEIKARLLKEKIEIFLPKEENIIDEFRRIRMKIEALGKSADCIIAYNVQYPWLHIRSKAKKVLILADYTPANEEKKIKKVYSYLIKKSFEQYNKIVVLSEKSKKYVNPKQKCTVIHGCIKWDNFQHFHEPCQHENIVFLYSGALNHVTGVDLLLEAFLKTRNKDYRLILCGQGDELKEQIENAEKKDDRISFMGYVSKKNYLLLLEKSNVVVNPRNMNFEQNEYNFPSKILEYLASGRIVLSTKFKGWREFEQNIEFVESNVEDLYKGLEKAAYKAVINASEFYKKNRVYAKKLTWDKYKEYFLA